MDAESTSARCSTFRSGPTAWPTDIPQLRVCLLSSDPRHHRCRAKCAGFDSLWLTAQHCGRHHAEQPGQSERLARKSAKDQTGQSHGYDSRELGGPAAARSISGESQMSATQDVFPRIANEQEELNLLDKVWRHPRGFFGWLSYTTHQAIGMRYIVT